MDQENKLVDDFDSGKITWVIDREGDRSGDAYNGGKSRKRKGMKPNIKSRIRKNRKTISKRKPKKSRKYRSK